MTDKPILFSGPMVRAIIEGRKTQTRRAIKSARVFATPETGAFTLAGDDMVRALQGTDRFRRIDGNGWFWEADAFAWQAPATRTCWMAHFGPAPGDLLWVRESAYFAPNRCAYAADNPALKSGERVKGFGRKRPSIHMPRWASRLTLEVTGVKVERVTDISENDAIAEGCTASPCARCDESGIELSGEHKDQPCEDCAGRGELRAVAAFGDLWNSLNKKRRFGWDANPWVVAITFTVHQQNIDKLLAARVA